MVGGHHDRYHAEVRAFHPQLSASLTRTVSSLTWLSLLPFSTNIGQVALLCTGPGILCASASVFTSLVYVRNRQLLERIMKDKVGIVHLHFVPSRSS